MDSNALERDWALIEASFCMQYGIRLSCEDITTGEFLRLFAGLLPETPLGRAVANRPKKGNLDELQKNLADMFGGAK